MKRTVTIFPNGVLSPFYHNDRHITSCWIHRFSLIFLLELHTWLECANVCETQHGVTEIMKGAICLIVFFSWSVLADIVQMKNSSGMHCWNISNLLPSMYRMYTIFECRTMNALSSLWRLQTVQEMWLFVDMECAHSNMHLGSTWVALLASITQSRRGAHCGSIKRPYIIV
jgi:hypothetical protein